ncbi:MAG: DUF1611 domain-containing protein [Prochloraceae cyanobacterium]
MLKKEDRVVILLHQGFTSHHGKTGISYLRYGESEVVAIVDRENAGKNLSQFIDLGKNIPIVANVNQAFQYDPTVLLIGIAPSGGALPEAWYKEVEAAVEGGLSLVNGLHTPLADKFGQLKDRQWIWDIRAEPKGLKIGTAKARSLSCQRILTVGTDMGVGKMSATIELHRSALKKGIKSKFLATGQSGIAIAASGIPLDAIRVDFAAGAVEKMVLDAAEGQQLLLIEGQGSLLHPGSTATLPLIRGSQPTGLILVHRAGQKHLADLPEIEIPPLTEVIKLYETLASAGGTFGKVKVKAIALNTFHLDLNTAKKEIEKVKIETNLPCNDLVRFDAEEILNILF